ncbi:MAG: outer membrane lipoprotein-sorting protein [Pseudomonadota bacterium]
MKHWIFALAALLAAAGAAHGESAEEKGLRLAQEADERDMGFINFTADMNMILRNRAGEESVRDLRIRVLEMEKDGDKSLSLFDEPADVKGTAMLTFSHGLDPDDQWLYLPALQRVKRISSRNKSGPFMGSEFAYEDLGSQEVEKYGYKYVRDEPCGKGLQCWVVERTPAYKYSGYSRQVVWLDQQEYRPMKVEFYDRKGAHLKTLEYEGYQEYLGHYWRPDEMFMQNHLTGKSTRLSWKDYRFREDLGDRDFNKNALARLR